MSMGAQGSTPCPRRLLLIEDVVIRQHSIFLRTLETLLMATANRNHRERSVEFGP